MKSDWGKGYGRKGAALHGLGRFDQAIAAYEKGLDVEPGLSMLTKGLEDAKREAENEKGAGGLGGLGNVFSSPDLLPKIMSNPQTAAYVSQPDYMMKLQEIQQNPSAISKHMQDPRILQTMGMLMGVNIQSPESAGMASSGASSSAKAPEPVPEPEPEVELTEEEKAAKAKKDAADKHKLKGNEAYKAKKFDEAVTHYEAAIAALPEEMTYYNNLAAVFYEQKKFDACIEKCKKAIELGRAARADYKVVAKSFARIGNAYKAMDKLEEAKRAYEDSLMEDRTEDVEKRLKLLQKEMKKREVEAYINPEEAEKSRQEGNDLFKRAQTENDISLYAKAIEKYGDAMKRNPKDHVPYSNRAACYQKLMEWQLALKDCETCVTMEPVRAHTQQAHTPCCQPAPCPMRLARARRHRAQRLCCSPLTGSARARIPPPLPPPLSQTFVKGWSRKAGVHYFLKEYHKAMDAYNMILKLEPDNEEAKNGLDQVVAMVNSQSSSGEVDQERQARAMADPEIQAILGDAQMRSILSEMQSDPKKAQAAMSDPTISAKLQKLIAAGVLQVR